MFEHSAKSRHGNESNKIMIKPDKIFFLQRLQFIKDTQLKAVEETSLLIERSFH